MKKINKNWCQKHGKPPINDKHECMDCHPEKRREEIWCPECKIWTDKWPHQGAFLCPEGDHIIRMMTNEDYTSQGIPGDFLGFPKDTFKAEKTLTRILEEKT